MIPPTWLPAIVTLADHGGDWNVYLDALYGHFAADFVTFRPVFRGERVGHKRYPMDRGKEATFWHLISEGASEDARVPEMRRCERIRWPRPVIENERDAAVKVWGNERQGEKRICLWFESEDYLVVLAQRKTYILLWTAYLVTEPHRKRKLEKEFQDSRNS